MFEFNSIGTTVTGVLAAFAANADRLAPSLQIALCHLLFNFSGVLLFYPLPLLRRVPLRVARAIGKLSADYRWFAVVYICNMFLVVPGLCFGLSLAGPYVFYGVIGAVFLLVASLLALHFLQRTKPALLPPAMRTFGFLPLPLRSLDPADRVLKRVAQFICAPFRCLRSRFSSDSNNENCEVEADGMKHMGTSSISVATLTTVSSAVSGRSNSSLEVAGRDQRAVNSNISHL